MVMVVVIRSDGDDDVLGMYLLSWMVSVSFYYLVGSICLLYSFAVEINSSQDVIIELRLLIYQKPY